MLGPLHRLLPPERHDPAKPAVGDTPAAVRARRLPPIEVGNPLPPARPKRAHPAAVAPLPRAATLAELMAFERARTDPPAAAMPSAAATAAAPAAAAHWRDSAAQQRLLDRARRRVATPWLMPGGAPRALEGKRLLAFDALVRQDVMAYAKAHRLEPRIAAAHLHRAVQDGGLDPRIGADDRAVLSDALQRLLRGQPLRATSQAVPPPDDRHAAERLPPGPVPANAPYPMVTGLLRKYEGEDRGTSYGTSVAFLDAQERKAYELRMVAGRLVDAQGRPFDTRGAPTSFLNTKGTAIFVMDAQGRLYAARDRVAGQFQHSSFLAGGAVAAAGEIEVHDGRVRFLSGKSGHYRPTPMQLDQMAHRLVAGGQKQFVRDATRW